MPGDMFARLMKINHGILVKMLRRDRKISRDKLAEMAGMTPERLRVIESPSRNLPEMDEMRALARALDVPVERIL